MFDPGEKELLGDILLQVRGCLQLFQLSLILQNYSFYKIVMLIKLSPVITCILQVFCSSFADDSLSGLKVSKTWTRTCHAKQWPSLQVVLRGEMVVVDEREISCSHG